MRIISPRHVACERLWVLPTQLTHHMPPLPAWPVSPNFTCMSLKTVRPCMINRLLDFFWKQDFIPSMTPLSWVELYLPLGDLSFTKINKLTENSLSWLHWCKHEHIVVYLNVFWDLEAHLSSDFKSNENILERPWRCLEVFCHLMERLAPVDDDITDAEGLIDSGKVCRINATAQTSLAGPLLCWVSSFRQHTVFLLDPCPALPQITHQCCRNCNVAGLKWPPCPNDSALLSAGMLRAVGNPGALWCQVCGD